MQRHHAFKEDAAPHHEGQPLMKQDVHHPERHLSFQESESFGHYSEKHRLPLVFWKRLVALVLVVALSVVVASRLVSKHAQRHDVTAVISIQDAIEHYLDIGNLTIWFRTWGNRQSGIPVLFVHGGPGNCIADYGNGNARFFDARTFWVVEVDQRGTGNSQPSVRRHDGCQNMKYYINLTIDEMSHDYELVRKDLNISKWLVFGGSWGSTLALDYVERYPHRALGAILRGIWLNSRPEFAMFLRNTYINNTQRLEEFDTWFELAAKDAIAREEPPLDPNDGERFFRINERMILECNEEAIWRHFVWENNMMEEDEANLLDPYTIEYDRLPEATSVAFFENQLFLHGTFDRPMKLLDHVDELRNVPTWMCQGLRDAVCPVQYGAQRLANYLIDAGVSTRMQFLDAGHEDTDTVIAKCLEDSVNDFVSKRKKTIYN